MTQVKLEDWVGMVRSGGKVLRCHTVPVHKNETVAHHSWGVAMLLMKFNPKTTKTLLCAALTHDVTEVFTGDVPAQAKWQFPELREALDNAETQYSRILDLDFQLTEEEQHWLKVCDHIDLILYSLEEIYMGNHNVREIVERLIDRLDSIGVPDEIARYYSFIKRKFYEIYPQPKENKHVSK
jgi:5'-deoxynucleotidase YfbR-like HD superfamily hydrolase